MRSRPEHEVAYQDLCALVNKHAPKLSSLELLAVAANMLGKLVALQDQRAVTPSEAMEVVAKNVELGNRQAIAEVSGKSAGSA
jgi:hypothetical protein